MPPSLFDRLPEELITKILDMIFEESDDYPEGAHYFLEYQIFKRDPENYHGCFEIEFLVYFFLFPSSRPDIRDYFLDDLFKVQVLF